MKIGRNDPCHCGSGKKYKQCCLKADRGAVRTATMGQKRTMEKPVDPIMASESMVLSDKLSQPEKPVAEPEPEDPHMAAINAFYEVFIEAEYEQQWALATSMLAEKPELCDSEMAFEIANTLYQHAIEAGDIEQFQKLLTQIEEMAPEAWAANLNLMLEWRASSALLDGDREGASEAFLALSLVAGADLDTYYRILSQFGWHGELELLVAGMHKALPSIKGSDDVVPWAYDEFAENLADYEEFQAVGTGASATDLYAILVERFTVDYGLTLSESFATHLAYLTGEQLPIADLAAYALDPQVDASDDPGRVQLSYLVSGFCHYAWREAGIPLARIAQAREHLNSYLAQSGLGILTKTKSPRRSKTRRRAKPIKKLEQKHYLIPKRKLVDAYISENLIRFLFTPYYKIAAFAELLPVWLRYLHGLEMVSERQMNDAFADLDPLIVQIGRIVTQSTADPTPEAVLGASQDAAGTGRV